MGRISKRHASGTAAQKKETARKVYKTAVYARLSVDTDARKNESIDTQVELIKDFIHRFNEEHVGERMEIYDIYTDLGKTGTNFDRDAFARLMQDVRMREVNCIIVKDLSRFGRDYMDVGDYIDKIFPFLGVRFIAVSDHFDTGAAGNQKKELVSEIKNLVNDMYAKDFSKKAKLSHKQRRERGDYIGGPAPYGYKSVMEDGIRRLYPNGETEEIVRFIYETFIKVKKYTGVSDELNRKRINPPAVYNRTGEVYFSGKGEYTGWRPSLIRDMLKSEIYRGNLYLGKWDSRKPGDTNARKTSEDEWVRHYGTHEGIISEDMIKKADEVISEVTEKWNSRRKVIPEHGKMENLFEDVIFCGVCGKAMTRSIRCTELADGSKNIYETYGCSRGGKSDNDRCGSPNNISKQKLLEILVPVMRQEFALYLSEGKKMLSELDALSERTAIIYEKEIRTLRQECLGCRERMNGLYMEYWQGGISQEQYPIRRAEMEEKYHAAEKKLAEKEEQLAGLAKKTEKCKKALRAVLRLKNGDAIDREMVLLLVKKIKVYPGRRIEVEFDYSVDMEGRQ